MYKSKDFTELRYWTMPNDSNMTIDDVKTAFKDLASAADIPVYISDIEIDNNIPAFEIRSLKNSNYMGVYVYYYSNFIGMALEGKGEQIKAPELESLFQKAAGGVLGVYNAYKYGRNSAMRFGISKTAGGISAGLGAITGGVVKGSAKLIAKGVKALLRDQEAYDKEMAFYQIALGLGDYLVGASDTNNIISKLRARAEEGDQNAQYWMGSAYVEGRGVQPNLDEAVKFFALAAAQDEKRSKEILAVEYLYGEQEYSVEKKHTGLKYMREIADAGDEDAAINIIDIYGFNAVDGIPADLSKLIEAAEVYADRGNTYAIIVLAHTYDTLSTNEAVSDASYKDDKKAVRWYERILILGDQEYKEEASMCLANMYMEGRGVEEDPARGVKYLELAVQCGNMEAKAVLAYYRTLGIGVEKDYATAQRLCKEVIQRGNQNERSIAYYCSYRIFDEAKKFNQSMEYARKCLESGNIDENKKAELERYLAEKEEAISKMTDEERREYLQERKPVFNFKSKEKKEGTNRMPWIIIGIVVLVIICVTIFINTRSENDGYSVLKGNNTTIDSNSYMDTEESYEACMIYNEFLSQESIIRDVGGMEYEWYLENCDFALAYIDDDDIPELLLYNWPDTDHMAGYGILYSIKNGEIYEIKSLSLNDVRGIGYYERTGWYMDHYAATGYGDVNISCLNKDFPVFGFSLEYDDNGESEIVSYYIAKEGYQSFVDIPKNEFTKELEKETDGIEMSEYVFFNNTMENRSEYLGVPMDEEKSDYEEIDSEDEAIEYVQKYISEHDISVDGLMIDGGTENGYIVRGYEDMDTHINTILLWHITYDGEISDWNTEEVIFVRD